VGLLGKSVQVSVWLGEAGQLPLMAALASRARVYFGADTSTMHVAEAVGTPVVAVFGGGHWPRFRPVLPESLALVHPLPCFGCGWHCHLDDALCIKLIQPADVIAAWGRRLAKEAPRALRSGTVELSRLSPELLQSLGRSRQLYEHDQRDSEERYAQILRLTVLARENEKTIVTLNNAAAELQAQNQSLKTALATSQGGMTEQASRLRAAEDSGTELARQNREVATIAQQAQAAAGRQQEQVVQLTALLKQSETEALARSRQIDQLTQLALTWEADANPRQQQIGSLTALLRAAEESRAELMRQNRELTTMVQQAQTDASAQREQVNQLTALFKASETESLARSGQIDQLTKLALTREADANARQQQIETLTAMVEAAQEAGASLQRQIGELTALLSTADEARAQLLQLNRELVSDARRQTAQWRESLLGLSREASLGSQLLAKLAAQTPTAPGDHPLLPIPCPGSPPAEEEIVFNVESFETSGDGMSVNGWAFLRSARDCRNTHIALALVVGDAWFVVPAAVVARPDVAAAHPCQDGTERYRSHAGFHCRFDRRALPALPVTVHLILQAGDAPGLYSPGFALPA
jgi:hypothetical protein